MSEALVESDGWPVHMPCLDFEGQRSARVSFDFGN